MADVMVTMVGILVSFAACLGGLSTLLTRPPGGIDNYTRLVTVTAKYKWESFSLGYGVVWMACFAVIIAFQLYEQFNEVTYFGVLFGLCVPLFVYPLVTERHTPLLQRYGVRASLWLAIFSHIGNYWYTHYFYCVLKAEYTFPSWRLNNVPLCLYFATFFYFAFYHALSNRILGTILTRYRPSHARTLFFWSVVFALSYTIAFMETLTISGFPHYRFEDRDMAYTVGSAFYGIYFIVSFPLFFRLDETSFEAKPSMFNAVAPFPMLQTSLEALGAGMLVLTLLDAVRLTLGVNLVVGVSERIGRQ